MAADSFVTAPTKLDPLKQRVQKWHQNRSTGVRLRDIATFRFFVVEFQFTQIKILIYPGAKGIAARIAIATRAGYRKSGPGG